MKISDKLIKIEKEIELGLKYISVDRLRNLIKEYPNNMKIRGTLAELFYESGFLDAAGRYSILTEPTEIEK